MEKITPAVIVALIVGLVVGYFVKGSFPPNQTSQNTSESIPQKEATQAPAGSNQTKIMEAMSAAPGSVAKNATILDYPDQAGADPAILQKGTNDWSCFPDYPSSPGKDPMCVDKQGMVWLQGYISQKPPNLTQTGLAYMLEGGSDASNTDPFAEKPTEGEDWITTPPHTMVFPVGKLDTTVYSKDPKNGGSWIMWAGTPYEHLMVPVK